MKKLALISVSDKTGVVDFAAGLTRHGFTIISTGGTLKTLQDAGISAIEASEITGFPECLDGRLKTLHPHIHGGILARRDMPHHMDFLASAGIDTIDLVCVNLYPFKQTIRKTDDLAQIIENIDIGGPAMLRSAAKNYDAVTVVVDADDYSSIIAGMELELEQNSGTTTTDLRFKLAAKAFAHTAGYDAMVAGYLGNLTGAEAFPDTITLTYEKQQGLRYGENPHQNAAYYREIIPGASDLVNAKQIHGKELSFNNINDTHGALELLRDLGAKPAIVAVKHATPCGVGTCNNLLGAWQKAHDADPISIFGGIIAANQPVDADVATEINKIFVEIVIAPAFTPAALEILTAKKNIRLLTLNAAKSTGGLDIKKVSGGLLIQDADDAANLTPTFVTEKQPTTTEMEDLQLAWVLAKHVKSNGIAIVKNGQSLGLAGGQVNRLWATQQALDHAIQFFGADALKGAVMASDGFFPFDDCVALANAAGITAIAQPGGSQNDQASIDACNKAGIAMATTGIRHFRH
ncbi:MAG: bifunctional phosphoribosylaminoimidazolecarboxamide formyltransferase/IMP cyclohydrolase [Defluviitaleaceae bacterium]|nr:bifunctional phosphoribosylaminoimidazolecarboxamide formyltransferase/IMP cyclohydrolase [Defluviitaleaceae bacterium]